MDFAEIAAALDGAGMTCRGGFHPCPADRLCAMPDGRKVGTVVLAGNVGPAMWDAFRRARTTTPSNDPLNDWTRTVLEGVAERFGARALFPFDGPPFHPFQRWAQRAEPVWRSPIGTLIHAEYGLWHAYRGALAFAETLPLPALPERRRPCDTCAGKPCVNTCPVEAFTPGDYDVARCREHIGRPAGRECLNGGCLARRACPVGRQFRYPPEQARFHMTAFLSSGD